MDARNLPGPLKVAILIQSLDQGAAQRIIGGLNDKERKLIHSHLNQMGPVAPVLIEKVAREFAQKIQQARNRRTGNGGQNKAAGKQIDGPKCPADGSNLKAVLSLAPDQLFELIKDEHPQTIAIVLVHLETAVASDILSKMPDDLKAEVAVRIAGLDKVSAGMVTEINCVFEEILKNKDTSVTRLTGGVERLAEILNQSDEHSSQLVLSQIEESDPDLAAQIKQMMFVFEDLVLVDDRGFQKVLRKVETAELAMALKAASQEVKDKVFRNMSARAGEMLTEEISNMGPVRMKDVSDAQQKITLIIQEMESKGELLVGGRRGEEFVT
ncbi:MAG: flagellar motor switch protein FliG [Desulfobacterales bacterium]|nr:flagellar motor switch protein FliG [Desulfobacterales bacterium]